MCGVVAQSAPCNRIGNRYSHNAGGQCHWRASVLCMPSTIPLPSSPALRKKKCSHWSKRMTCGQCCSHANGSFQGHIAAKPPHAGTSPIPRCHELVWSGWSQATVLFSRNFTINKPGSIGAAAGFASASFLAFHVPCSPKPCTSGRLFAMLPDPALAIQIELERSLRPLWCGCSSVSHGLAWGEHWRQAKGKKLWIGALHAVAVKGLHCLPHVYDVLYFWHVSCCCRGLWQPTACKKHTMCLLSSDWLCWPQPLSSVSSSICCRPHHCR